MEEDRSVRACAILGAIWTLVGSAALTLEMNAAVGGRGAFVHVFGGGGVIRHGLEALLVVGAGLAWAGLSLKLRTDAPSIKGFRRLQYATMPLALAFLVVHAWLTWVAATLGTDAGSVYEGLRRSLPSYPMIGIYVVGLATLGLATEQALLVCAAVTGFVSRPVTMRWFRVLAAVLPMVFFIVSINGVGHFAAGRGLLWRPPLGEETVAPDEPVREREQISPVGNPEGDPEREPPR